MSFYDLEQMEYKFKRDGVHLKSISGEKLQVTQVRLDAGFQSDHSHPEEQIGLVLSGQIRLTIGHTSQVCEAGDAYHIPANVRHSFKVISSPHAEILDIFSPPKEENII